MVREGPFMPRPPFEILEHTADVGIVAHGGSLAELFANAATGMFAIMAELEGDRPPRGGSPPRISIRPPRGSPRSSRAADGPG